ncbi:MAG: SCO family protein [Burkholderiales bacterium]|nr:SCO family protein [Burkholderiales bacterium]
MRTTPLPPAPPAPAPGGAARAASPRQALARPGRRRRQALPAAAWVSATLCLLMLAGLGAGLHHWTAGFEAWTYEARRERQIDAGLLRAPALALRGADGRPVRLRQDGGAAAATLVDFIYTRCPGVCRTLGSEFQQMQQQLAEQPAAVRLASISFDLAHDDAAALARHAASLRAQPRWWTLAVPDSPADAQALLRALGVVVVPDGQGGWVHNGAIHLLDGQGRLRGLYGFNQWPQALADARALASRP